MEEDLPSKWGAKKAGVAILISNKMDLKPTKIKREKEEHYVRINATRRANYPKYICRYIKYLDI